MNSSLAQHSAQFQKMQGEKLTERIQANASIIWPGQGRSVEIDCETDDYVNWYCVLQELCGDLNTVQWYEPRTMTVGSHSSTDLAARALDRYLQDLAGAKLAQERQRA